MEAGDININIYKQLLQQPQRAANLNKMKDTGEYAHNLHW